MGCRSAAFASMACEERMSVGAIQQRHGRCSHMLLLVLLLPCLSVMSVEKDAMFWRREKVDPLERLNVPRRPTKVHDAQKKAQREWSMCFGFIFTLRGLPYDRQLSHDVVQRAPLRLRRSSTASHLRTRGCTDLLSLQKGLSAPSTTTLAPTYKNPCVTQVTVSQLRIGESRLPLSPTLDRG